MKYLVQKDAGASGLRLAPGINYLRITIDGRTAFFALGDVDRDAQGAIEVWYSTRREVLRLQNGRILGVMGTPTEWRNVSLPPVPPWLELAKMDGVTRWVRTRDVMPGYRYGVRDSLILRGTPPPLKSALQDLDPGSLTWFEEYLDPSVPVGSKVDALPTARYAVQFRNDAGRVVYGEQCLAPDLCFSWQRWSAANQSAAKAQ